MPSKAANTIPKAKRGSNVKMGAKISNQINTNQQSNMSLSAYCVVTQTSSIVNINFA